MILWYFVIGLVVTGLVIWAAREEFAESTDAELIAQGLLILTCLCVWPALVVFVGLVYMFYAVGWAVQKLSRAAMALKGESDGE